MSFRKLEILSGVSRSEISYIINKKRKQPNPEILRAIAPHLKVKYEYLLYLGGYLSEESWSLIDAGKPKNGQMAGISAKPESIHHAPGLLSPEEEELLVAFKKIRDKSTRSFLHFFMQLALKAEKN
ncbi:MAG: helix-turn-helix transcriptional regulator [Nitrospinae bacterium]|nr:helix-turn-helix transcriptional regulator [Nitrospinota bacterium]